MRSWTLLISVHSKQINAQEIKKSAEFVLGEPVPFYFLLMSRFFDAMILLKADQYFVKRLQRI